MIDGIRKRWLAPFGERCQPPFTSLVDVNYEEIMTSGSGIELNPTTALSK
jgi:hypothetical protein